MKIRLTTINMRMFRACKAERDRVHEILCQKLEEGGSLDPDFKQLIETYNTLNHAVEDLRKISFQVQQMRRYIEQAEGASTGTSSIDKAS